MLLTDIKPNLTIRGIVPGQFVTIVAATPQGATLSVVYRDSAGGLGERMLFPADEPSLEVVEKGKPWSFEGDAADFKLAAEAYRIHLAHLFDPLMAVHSSAIEPLPHQITAVYETMLERHPLRFVLADDPGAGKTIMAGLLIRELMIRGDVKRCLIVAPGSLTEQWQDELDQKFSMRFELFGRAMVENSASGNPFNEKHLLIARVDQLSRAEDLQEKLEVADDWDLVVVDEAHKMAASYYGNKFDATKRYALGEKLREKTRHFLLMTATPHNGKEQDFQAFMALVDPDRFEGKFREGVHEKIDVSDLMRRMIKEDLLKFDGTRLFPERRAQTAKYKLSSDEMRLYESVTAYVREEMARADDLDQKRRGTVGFALTILQRRLASSPEAICRSLERRAGRLEDMLAEVKARRRSLDVAPDFSAPDDFDRFYDEENEGTIEEKEEELVDQATAARSVEDLQREIVHLQALVKQARTVRDAEVDRKWAEFSRMLQDTPEMHTSAGAMRKTIVFTEHRDTLNYLFRKIANLLGSETSTIVIHGGMNREKRREAQEIFWHNKDVVVLLATDAAGEGVNLQCASIMVNYDLPWNPNRLEQRFGRIHRIGQTEMCHMWSMVAVGTREGDVFARLLDKLEAERKALGGKVFDILGQAFENRSLKDLLIDAIRHAESPEAKARVLERVDTALQNGHLQELIERNALASEHMDAKRVFAIREQMEKAQARKLQPHFIKGFFEEALAHYEGRLYQREPGRFEITHVPAAIRGREPYLGHRLPVLRKYERVCFEKGKIRQEGRPVAALLFPGQPLMDATINLILDSRRDLLKRGTVLVDTADDGDVPRVMFIIDHAVRDGAPEKGGMQRVISRRMQFVEMGPDGSVRSGGYAPYLDCDVPSAAQLAALQPVLQEPWLTGGLEEKALAYATERLVPDHYNEVRTRREKLIDLTTRAVRERLTKEINHLTRRYEELKAEAAKGRQPRMQPENMRRQAEELAARLDSRNRELELERHIVSATPVIVGGAFVVPMGLMRKLTGEGVPTWTADAAARAVVEKKAMDAVMAWERQQGHDPLDVSRDKEGWDVLSRCGNGDVRFIEVKGRAKGADTVTVTKNEILACLNQPERYLLAIVFVDGQTVDGPHYVATPFTKELDFGVTSVTVNIAHLLSTAGKAPKHA